MLQLANTSLTDAFRPSVMLCAWFLYCYTLLQPDLLLLAENKHDDTLCLRVSDATFKILALNSKFQLYAAMHCI